MHSDLLRVALERVGHALGLSLGNTWFLAKSTNLNIVLTAPFPFPCTVTGLRTNFISVVSRIVTDNQYPTPLMDSHANGDRQIPSAVDVLVMAQLSQSTNLNLDFVPRLQIQENGTNAIGSWTEPWPGFQLQQNASLGDPHGWTAVPQRVTASNEFRNVNLPIGSGHLFFSLRKRQSFWAACPHFRSNPDDSC
jgi:hypothetical protein